MIFVGYKDGSKRYGGAGYGEARRANGKKSDNKCGCLNDEPSAHALVPIYMRDLPNLGSLPNSGYLSTGPCTATCAPLPQSDALIMQQPLQV